MSKKTMKIEAFRVHTDNNVCPGIAQTKVGEVYKMTGRTPDHPICVQALNSILPMAHAMSLTDKMKWEKKDFFEITCPHGAVTFMLSREKE